MTIIYIEDEIKKNKKKKEILDALESIGLEPLDLPDIEKDVKKIDKAKKSDLSLFVGEILAKRASEKNIKKVYFDRGCYKYHGRIKLLTDALRKHGLEF